MGGPILAAGGVVVRHDPADPEPAFLVVRRPRYQDWSLPKGKIEPDETAGSAALREVTEETGFNCVPRLEIGTIAYQLDNGDAKAVRYWLMEAGEGEFHPNDEVDEIGWLSHHAARTRLSYRKDRAVLDWAAALDADPDRGRVHLVRHAVAGSRLNDPAEDRQRNLSSRGRHHAEVIARRLARQPIERILTSPFTRCRQTVAVLSEILAVPIEEDQRLAEGSPPSGVRTVMKELRTQAAVLCTHGDIITGVIAGLADQGVRLGGDVRSPKGSVWSLETRGDVVTSASYRQPPK